MNGLQSPDVFYNYLGNLNKNKFACTQICFINYNRTITDTISLRITIFADCSLYHDDEPLRIQARFYVHIKVRRISQKSSVLILLRTIENRNIAIIIINGYL